MTGSLTVTNSTSLLSSYAYSYPHKSSYRPLSPAVSIAEAWKSEDVGELSLYVHIPFCEMRCGFCNLFTQSQPEDGLVESYLVALQRQMRVIRAAVPYARFSQFAIGGGTPTQLNASQLRRLLESVESVFGQLISQMSTSVETSPATATPDRLQVLSKFGVRRMSLGVQSFADSETRLFGRPQSSNDVHRAIRSIRDCGEFELNLDLIYGHPDQTRMSWIASLNQALSYDPEELYLYPLYIRPQTGLARTNLGQIDHRADLYGEALDLLSARGYSQSSLRCFRRAPRQLSSAYACQRDGMIGLGCGARSYVRKLHYATRFAVTQPGIRAIVRDWIGQTDEQFSRATHGIWLSEEEQMRRYLILTLLQVDGVSRTDFAQQFPSIDLQDVSGMCELRERGWLARLDDRETLTPLGIQHSDEVGLLLYSSSVRDRLREFVELSSSDWETSE